MQSGLGNFGAKIGFYVLNCPEFEFLCDLGIGGLLCFPKRVEQFMVILVIGELFSSVQNLFSFCHCELIMFFLYKYLFVLYHPYKVSF